MIPPPASFSLASSCPFQEPCPHHLGLRPALKIPSDGRMSASEVDGLSRLLLKSGLAIMSAQLDTIGLLSLPFLAPQYT